MSDEFYKGARAMFDYLLIRAANNYHGRREIQDICTKENKLITEWATDALEEISPDDYALWIGLSESYDKGYRQGLADGKVKDDHDEPK